MDLKEQVKLLEQKLYDEFGDNPPYSLTYSTTSFYEQLSLNINDGIISMEIGIWNSDNSNFKFLKIINDYETLESYLKRVISELKFSLNKLNKVL